MLHPIITITKQHLLTMIPRLNIQVIICSIRAICVCLVALLQEGRAVMSMSVGFGNISVTFDQAIENALLFNIPVRHALRMLWCRCGLYK